MNTETLISLFYNLNQRITTIESRINRQTGPYYFPGAFNWMWDHCIFLGKYFDRAPYDLGVYVDKRGLPHYAIVCGNEGGDYISGLMFIYQPQSVQKETENRWLTFQLDHL